MNFQAARVCDDCYQYLLKGNINLNIECSTTYRLVKYKSTYYIFQIVSEFEEKSENILNIIKNNNDLNDSEAFAAYQSAKISFKKHDPHNSRKPHRNPAPSWLKEVRFRLICFFVNLIQSSSKTIFLIGHSKRFRLTNKRMVASKEQK